MSRDVKCTRLSLTCSTRNWVCFNSTSSVKLVDPSGGTDVCKYSTIIQLFSNLPCTTSNILFNVCEYNRINVLNALPQFCSVNLHISSQDFQVNTQ